MVELCDFLEKQNKSYMPLSHFHYKYRGEFITFYDFVDKIIKNKKRKINLYSSSRPRVFSVS